MSVNVGYVYVSFWVLQSRYPETIPNPGLQIREIPDPKKPTKNPLVGCHDWYQIWQEMYADYD